MYLSMKNVLVLLKFVNLMTFKIVKTFCTNFVSAKILLSTCEFQFKRNLS